MNNKIFKYIIFLVIVVVLFIVGFIIYKSMNEEEDNRNIYLKNYKVNEYIPTYVSDNDMAKIYLTNYIYLLIENRIEAYNLLDESYRSVKFPTYESFNSYISSLDLTNIEMDKFYKKYVGRYLIFGVFDKNNNFFAFKTHGVMQYSVYLDDYTVEIG